MLRAAFYIRRLLVTGLFALAGAIPARAPGPPPFETYTCYQYTYRLGGGYYAYMGLFRLQPGGRYEWASAPGKPFTTGHYTASGPAVRFTDGSLQNATGAYTIGNRSRHTIEVSVQGKTLHPGDSGLLKMACQCDQHAPAKP